MQTVSISRNGFTLVELLAVIGIISLLAALLFPVFVQSRAKARQATCISNLRQIGVAVMLYSQDDDDLLPYGVDPDDKYTDVWKTAYGGKFWPEAISLPLLPELLHPYTNSKELWRCPSDVGFTSGDAYFYGLRPHGTLYETYGMSYFYHTILAFSGQSLDNMAAYDTSPPYVEHGPSEIRIMSDAVGDWHGEEDYYASHYDVLMGDGHVKTWNEEAQQNSEQWGLTRP